MTVRCKVCGTMLFQEYNKEKGICWKCELKTNEMTKERIIETAAEIGYLVVWSQINQGYIIVDERSNKLVGVKNTGENLEQVAEAIVDEA